jgi:hypothetical protein
VRPEVALAAVRAGYRGPFETETLAAAHSAARRTGRRPVDLIGAQLAVGWADGYGPNLDDEALIVGELSPTRLVALGVCLGLCWDAAGPPLPGRTVAVEQFDAALDQLGVAHIHVKSALIDLHEMQLVRFDGRRLALGAALADWSDADWAQLRALRSGLPEAGR